MKKPSAIVKKRPFKKFNTVANISTPTPLVERTGRGAQSNFAGRYNANQTNSDLENYGWVDLEDEKTLLKTQFFKDSSRSIVSENDSPDIGFTYSINAYRGCEHGCAYCYARPSHEYLNLSPGLDFESKIYVKYDAAKLLRKKLLSPSWKGDVIFMSGITDCYQPAERKFKITRSILEVMAEFRNPVGIITKNQLVCRDLDILSELAKYNAVRVIISVTSLDQDLQQVLEPRTSVPKARLKAIELLANAGICVGANVAPVIPGLTDHEMPAILKAVSEAGAQFAHYVPLRLPSTVAPIFEEWLTANRPERKDKVLNFIRSLRGGKLNNPNFGERMRGEGLFAQNFAQLFEVFSKKYKLNEHRFKLSSEHFRKVTDQMTFDV